MNSKVTVLMPTYNCMPHLKDAVQSVRSQTYENLTLIIADDGSTDETRTFIESLSDNRIEYIYSQHQGTGATCNNALKNIDAEYTARMDADDIMPSNRLEKQIAFLDKHQDVHMVGGQFEYFTNNIETAGFRTRLPLNHSDIVKQLLAMRHAICNGTLCFRTESAKAVGGYDTNKHGEDLGFFMKMSEKYTIENMSELFLYYRLHDQSVNAQKALTLRADLRDAVQSSITRRESQATSSENSETTHKPISLFTQTMDRIDVFAYTHYRTGVIHWINNERFIALIHFSISALSSPSRLLNYIYKRIKQ